jgi:7-cyano-7-deazaguanine synthase in queuosine biosynthesis
MTQKRMGKSSQKTAALSRPKVTKPRAGAVPAPKPAPSPVRNEVALMFSGGIDSLLAAVLLAKDYDKVHLLTFKRGYMELGIKNSLPNVERLKALCGEDKFVHEFVNIKPLVRRVSIFSIAKDRLRYGTEVVWCVACRTTMNAAAMLYALENDLAAISDGSNKEQIPGVKHLTGTAENYPSVVAQLKDFAKAYGVEFATPVYDFGDREERRRKLSELGFEIDYLSKDPTKSLKGMLRRDFFKRSQPLCLSGWIIHWRRNIFGVPVKQDEAKTREYVARKQERVIRRYFASYFKKRGVEIESLVRTRKAAQAPAPAGRALDIRRGRS